MAERQPAHMIRRLRQRWRLSALMVHITAALGLTAIITVLLCKVNYVPLWYAIPIGICCLLLLLLPSRGWRISDDDVVRYFNINYPELEESCELLLKPGHTLGVLEQLQARKVEQIFNSIPSPHPYRQQLRIAVLFMIAALLVSAALHIWWHPGLMQLRKDGEDERGQITTPAPVLPEITAVNITITPPAYTGKAPREQSQFDLEVEEGARLQWNIGTSKPVSSLQLLLNDTGRLKLKAQNSQGTQWRGSITAVHPGYYQVKVADKLSGLYKLALIKDRAPVITVHAPASYTVIDYGMPQKVAAKVTLTDDYGISAAGMHVTVASGSGEAVKFNEQALPFGAAFNGTRKQYTLERAIDLAALGMQPGTELYLYINAQDNHQQYARSGMYMIVLPDTAQLMSLEGLANSVNVKPEYFRSQRQIIIETEQLIRDEDTLAEKAFKARSNDLGIDQRLLRLRYGRFLGEESETNIGEERIEEEEQGHDHDHAKEEATVNAKDFNNAEKIIDQFSHRHDIAEDASFFDPATKQQLKATLTEMWNAELRLRTFKPREALPYEYKALRLLKDLQQKSRAYVGKTSVKTTPLKPEKRLTGELGKVIFPVLQHNYMQPSPAGQLPHALAILEQVKGGMRLSDPVTTGILQQAARQMSTRATASPARYLSSLQAMRQVLEALERGATADPALIDQASQAIYDMVPEPALLPQANRRTSGVALSQQYFKNLNRQQ